jgi:hypothetical protein
MCRALCTVGAQDRRAGRVPGSETKGAVPMSTAAPVLGSHIHSANGISEGASGSWRRCLSTAT